MDNTYLDCSPTEEENESCINGSEFTESPCISVILTSSNDHITAMDILHSDDDARFRDRKGAVSRPTINRRHSNDPKFGVKKDYLDYFTPPRNRAYTSLQKYQQTKSHMHLDVNTMTLDRRSSLGSTELSKTNIKKSILNRRSSSGIRLLRNQKSSEEICDSFNSENEMHAKKSPSVRKISNIFRKISTSSKNLSHSSKKSRSLMLLDLKDGEDKDKEQILQERDHAIEEWSRAATKCEELVDEVDMMLSHLVTLRTERDDINKELVTVLQYYEEDLRERDEYIEEMQSVLTEINDGLLVVKKERGEAYDERDKLLQELYECKKIIEANENENSNMKSKLESLKINNQIKDSQILSLESSPSIKTMSEQQDDIVVTVDDKDKPISLSKYDAGSNKRPTTLDIRGALTEKLLDKYHVTTPDLMSTPTDEYTEIAISIDLFDSRNGLKFENAFDEPHVMVSQVTAKLETKWNIRKNDRVLSVNGTQVNKLEKKIVEKLIRETTGRTITLVLRREQGIEGRNNFADIDLYLDKYNLDIEYRVVLHKIHDFSIVGMEHLNEEDIITKINSQDISKIISTIIKKMSKKSQNNKTTLRIQRNDGFTPDELHDIKMQTKQQNNLTVSSFTFPGRKKSMTSSEHSNNTRSIFGDLSSLYSFNPAHSQNNLDLNSVRKSQSKKRAGAFNKNSWRRSTVALPIIRIQNSSPFGSLYEKDINGNHHDEKSIKISEFSGLNSKRNSSIYSVPPCTPNIHHSPKIRKSYSERRSRNKYESLILYDNQNTPSPQNENVTFDGKSEGSNRDSMKLMTKQESDNTVLTKPSGEQREQKRFLKIKKSAEESVGFHIDGGNNIGIFISHVEDNSNAALSGIKVGDRLLKMNSTDLEHATLDYATKVLINQKDMILIRIEAQYCKDYKTVMQQKPFDSFYIRCKSDYTWRKNKQDMKVNQGDIIHITNSMCAYNKKKLTWSWYGEMVQSCYNKQTLRKKTSMETTHSISSSCSNYSSISKTKRSFSQRGIKKWVAKRTSSSRRSKSASDEDNTMYIENERQAFFEILKDTPQVLS